MDDKWKAYDFDDGGMPYIIDWYAGKRNYRLCHIAQKRR